MRLLPLVWLTLLLLAGCGAASDAATSAVLPPPATGPQSDSGLPGLGELRDNRTTIRRVTAAQYQLLPLEPYELSVPPSAVLTASALSLDPALNNGLAYAIFQLAGFPTDSSVYPMSVDISRDRYCWLAAANFKKGRWEFLLSDAPGLQILPRGKDLISPNGNVYLALLADTGAQGGLLNCTELLLTTNADMTSPAGTPLPNLTAIGMQVAGLPSAFTALGTDPGDGNITEITYNWGDGSPADSTADPLTELEHSYAASGSRIITLSVKNDSGKTGLKQFPITVEEPFRELLLIYNSDIPESAELAEYYASNRSGHGLDPAFVHGLPLGNPGNAAVDRSTYNSDIRDPIKAIISNGGFQNSLRYILLLKGVPFQLNDSGTGLSALYASVDSELCCLFSDNGPADEYPKLRWLGNSPLGLSADPVAGGFYLSGDEPFVHGAFQVCYDPTGGQPGSGDESLYPLDYLVGRLDAYTYDDAKALVDRALAAGSPGNGWVVFDSCAGSYGQDNDTMVDPVYPLTDASGLSGFELLAAAGINCFADITTTRITSSSAELPGSFSNSLIGYAGWGQNHTGGSYPNGGSYILKDLGWNYLPGACFMSYESFNGSIFSCSDPNDPAIGHPGQGMICDFFHMGGSVAIGSVFEPYTVGCGDERAVFDRYIIHGDRWIEAAYKGLRMLSWQEVVVGDPLCQLTP